MLFIFVLPLPFRIRRGIFSTYNQLTAKQQIKTIIFITGCLVGLLFIDSWKRSQIRVSLYHNDNSGSIGSSAVTPIQALASRAYRICTSRSSRSRLLSKLSLFVWPVTLVQDVDGLILFLKKTSRCSMSTCSPLLLSFPNWRHRFL